MTQEELEHLLENVDWEPKVDPLWAEASLQRLLVYADRVGVHRRHVRHWRLTLGSALAIVLVVLWWTQTAPLRNGYSCYWTATRQRSPAAGNTERNIQF